MNHIIKKNFNKIFKYILLIYVVIGFYLSINTGISTDEFIVQHKWNLNLEIIKFFLLNIGDGKFELLNYAWKYHGVGFSYISEPYVAIISQIIEIEDIPKNASKALLNHSLLFITFFLSGIIARKIIYLIIKDKIFSDIFLIFYLLYPYLLGHSFYNSTDIPFLFGWLISSLISIKIFLKINKDEEITYLNIFLLALATSFLFSIRISGILILFQYFIGVLITFNISKKKILSILKIYILKIITFVIFTISFTIMFYPILWINPYLIIDIINQQKAIPYGVCTLTLSNCMDSLNLPSTYIFIWLFFKIPLLSLFGLILFPIIEKKIFIDSNNKIIIGSIGLSVISIIFILIFLGANLYDELRHILFIVPLILIFSFTSLYFFSKKILLAISIISIIIFSSQNINMYPYQYTWFNFFGNFINLNTNFELDYWGVSGKMLAKKISENKILIKNKDKCIYVSPKHIFEPFISKKFSCVKPYLSIFPKSSEKYILVKYTRNIRRENPSGCKMIFDESYYLNIFSNKLTMGEVYLCN